MFFVNYYAIHEEIISEPFADELPTEVMQGISSIFIKGASKRRRLEESLSFVTRLLKGQSPKDELG